MLANPVYGLARHRYVRGSASPSLSCLADLCASRRRTGSFGCMSLLPRKPVGFSQLRAGALVHVTPMNRCLAHIWLTPTPCLDPYHQTEVFLPVFTAHMRCDLPYRIQVRALQALESSIETLVKVHYAAGIGQPPGADAPPVTPSVLMGRLHRFLPPTPPEMNDCGDAEVSNASIPIEIDLHRDCLP